MRRKLRDDEIQREAEMRAWAKQDPKAAAQLEKIDEMRRQTAEIEAENQRMREEQEGNWSRVDYWNDVLKIVAINKISETEYAAKHINGVESTCVFGRHRGFQDLHCRVPTSQGPLDYKCSTDYPPLIRKPSNFGLGEMDCMVDMGQAMKHTNHN